MFMDACSKQGRNAMFPNEVQKMVYHDPCKIDYEDEYPTTPPYFGVKD
jgi:hypothetical protein